ncbi:bestrophin family protein [Telluribacter sp. SYSU D00476]|uniref:bestrophin family protein n=1 Tax=Telluribacter sp. SYSU D00476 TaxID=2811430 RepID=UPI001FF284E0|nr:bestrophin family ion channel [Telluribacter sp. SYSU D00476]
MLLNKKVPVAYIFNKVKVEFIFVLIISLCVLFLTDEYQDFLPEMPLTVPAFIGTAISILLSFKLNQSYDRWWEARKVWGSIVNDSRSFVIQLQMLTARGNDTAIQKIAYRQIAWCYCLGRSLRGLDPLDNLEGLLSAEDFAAIKLHNNKSLALLQMHGRDIKELKENNQLDLFSQVQLDSTLVRLCEAQGKAERIKSTVFPVTYRLFLHYIIYLFVITLSISLEDVAGYFEVPLLMVLSMAFFLLERSATHMQDPFENRPTDTAMTAIARTIEINIRQLLKETDVPAPHQPEEFYLS